MAASPASKDTCVGFDVVYSREIDAINQRRGELGRPTIELPRLQESPATEPIYERSVDAGLIGLALSGGGIRSASFCLGAVQALDADHLHLLKKVDLLSTVSGGGYLGASLAASAKFRDDFPFPSELRKEEPKPLKHVRDHSNFLIPGGWIDVLGSVAVYLRGLVANTAIVLPWLLMLAAATLFLNPDVKSLSEPSEIAKAFLWLLKQLGAQLGVVHFAITITSSLILLFLLFLSAIGARIYRLWTGKSESDSAWTKIVGVGLIVIVLTAFAELQPYILEGIFREGQGSVFAWIAGPLQSIIASIAAVGGVLGFFWRTFEAWVRSAQQDSRTSKWLKAIVGRIAIYIGSLAVPALLWLLYLWLAASGVLQKGNSNFLQGLADRLFIGENALLGSLAVSEVCKMAALYGFLAAVLFAISWLFLDPNSNSLHRLYRDRLSKAFLFDLSRLKTLFDDIPSYGLMSALRGALSGQQISGDLPPLDTVRLSELSHLNGPYPLMNTAMNIHGSKYVNRRGRNADFFMFSKKFIGSEGTGYVRTVELEEQDRDLNLATVMAISGAAASSNMGSNSIRPMTPTLTMLNVRLGYWLRNPAWRSIRLKLAWRFIRHLNLYFFVEMFSLLREDSWLVYLTDGGHVENLGIFELLKRECRLIIAIDAEADPQMDFPSFVRLERHARIDLGVIIDLPWRRLRAITLETGKSVAATGGPEHAETRKGPHCVIGRIQYPKGHGYLVYVKASLSGDENDSIADYKRRHDSFPHETTGDQFFSEEQFEVYRALGFHAMRSFLKGDEETPTFADRHADLGPTPPLYERPLSAKGRKAINEIRAILGLKPLARARKSKRARRAARR